MPVYENRPKRPLPGAPILATRSPPAQARASGDIIKKGLQSAWRARRLLQQAQLRTDPVPHFLAQRRQRLDRPDHDLEFDHFAGLAERDEINALELPFADIGAKFRRGVV
jgi:hypothetical protein